MLSGHDLMLPGSWPYRRQSARFDRVQSWSCLGLVGYSRQNFGAVLKAVLGTVEEVGSRWRMKTKG